MGNTVIAVPEMPAHCLALLRASGGIFGREKNIFGFRVINCMYWALVRVSGWVWCGGFQRMGLDDDFPIGKVLPFWDGHVAWARARCWARFSIAKICLLVDSIYVHLFHSFLGIWVGRNGWMALDDIPNLEHL